ncbi:DNA-binding response regulator [Kocuria dechangensis]|uniref:DNA-binding response regulator n=1 Tax=Kocuria dechangensis TaxID=1176249 RepID=A0A917GQ02_9MICC|nr:response regulator transcription factor [Kocuria dechangensis]GGG53196.1 DNA-binding response regulator [Kocuria dechangensis]
MTDCRLLVVDDQPLMLEALKSFFSAEPGFEVIGTAANGREAVDRCLASDPDVVLMDMKMPVMDGIEATREITSRSPRSKVLALTTFSTLEFVVPALRAGAAGYLVKDARPDEIITAVHQVLDNEIALSPTIARALADNVISVPDQQHRPADDGLRSLLTEREMETVTLLAQGLSNREIAEQMHVSEGSVKAYLGRVCEKFGVRDRVQALIKAYQSGLVEPQLRD